MTAISMGRETKTGPVIWPLGLIAATVLLMVISPYVYLPEWLMLGLAIGVGILLVGLRYYWIFVRPNTPDEAQPQLRQRVINGLKSQND